MATIILPHFGELDTEALEEFYDAEMELNGETIELDVNFEGDSIDPLELESVKRFLDNIPAFDKQNQTYIAADYADEEADTVKTYVDHHLEDIGQDDLGDLIDFENAQVPPADQLVKALKLVRVGIYPDSEEQFATFDYSIGQHLTNYMVVVFTDQNGQLDYMTIES